jgi:hypothetical protein
VSGPHNARDLTPDARQVVEQLLGRPLAEDEEISILAYKPCQAPSPEAKKAARRGLQEFWTSLDERTKDISLEDQDEILDEAMRSVRPAYRSID